MGEPRPMDVLLAKQRLEQGFTSRLGFEEMVDRAKSIRDLTWHAGDSDFYWNLHLDGDAPEGAGIMIYLPAGSDYFSAEAASSQSREHKFEVEIGIPEYYSDDAARAFLRLITDQVLPTLDATLIPPSA